MSGAGRLIPMRRRLLSLAIIAALPLAVVFGFALRTLLQHQTAETGRAALDLSRALATSIDNELRQAVSALEVLALAEPMGATAPQELALARRLADGVLASRPEWLAIVLSRPSGEIVVNTSSSGSTRVIEPESLAELVRTRTPTIGNLTRGLAGKPGIPVRVPVVRDGELRYALTAVLRPEAVASVVSRQRLPDDWVVSVFDAALARVARSREPTPAPGGPSDSLRSLIATMGDRPQVFGATVTIEGTKVHTAVARLRSAQWIVALGVPTAVTETAVMGSALAYGASLVLSIALGGLALRRVSRGVEEPVQQLTRSAESLGRDEPVRGVRTDIAELAAMSDALVVAAQQRAKIAGDRESLHAAERQARAAAETAQHRMQVLLRASTLLTASLEESSTLNAIASLIVPELADACRIDLLDAAGQLQRKITFHVDPVRQLAIEQFVGRTVAPPDTPGTFPWAIATGQTYLADFPSPDEAPFDDAVMREFARIVGIRTLLVVPLLARGQTIGAMAVMQAESGRRIGADDAALIGELAQRAALALDNARLFAESRSALNEAAVANRTKDEFLAMLGHELRNPLAPIVTSLEAMARRGDIGGPERLVIERQVRHLARLVDDLLDVSRIASGKVALRHEVVDLRDVVGRALELIQPALQERSPPAVRVSGSDFKVEGDPTRLTQVVCNLLNNATKYTEPEQPIDVVLERRDRWVRLTVRDEGIGIRADLLTTIFDRFAQGDQEPQRSKGGLGLGLAIARNLVELHGGTIRAESDGPGRGSAFIVELPACRAAASEPAAASPPRAAVRPRRVLLVDDNVDAADALQAILAMDGHEVRTAKDGGTALQALQDFEPDIALLDVGLPDMTGYQLAGKLKSEPRWRSIRLIALTGYGTEADRQRALDAGFDVHLVKPATFEAIERVFAQFG